MRSIAAFVLVAATLALSGPDAFARGGGSNLFNSPGYQRRLQESRGLVPTRSTSQPYTKPPAVYPGRKWRKRARHF